MSASAATSRATFETYLVVSVAGELAKNLSVDEIYCLLLLMSLMRDRGGVFISEWRRRLPVLGSEERGQVAFQGLIDKGIVEHEPLPEDIRHIFGGSTVGLTVEILDRL